jgi:MFS family permease
MQLCQMTISPAVGALSDRFGNKPVLLLGVVGAASGPLFWLMAGPETWWIIYGAYLAWGAWAAVNICGQNLMLKLAPEGNNATHIAVYQGLTGLCAGVSGVLGGYVFDWLAQPELQEILARTGLTHYELLFLVSWLGRTSAILWIFPIVEPQSRSIRHMLRALGRVPSLRPRRLALRAMGAFVTLRQARSEE